MHPALKGRFEELKFDFCQVKFGRTWINLQLSGKITLKFAFRIGC